MPYPNHTHRKYTKQKAKELSLTGAVENLSNGDVYGVAEGESSAVETFKTWLSETGSPKSRIDQTIFEKEERDITAQKFSDFDIIGR